MDFTSTARAPTRCTDSPAGRERHPVRNLDPLPDAVVVRDHEVAVAANAELAHNRRMRALEHAQDLAVRAAVRFDAADARHHAIAVHGAPGVFLGNVDVALQAGDRHIRRDEGEAVAMRR